MPFSIEADKVFLAEIVSFAGLKVRIFQSGLHIVSFSFTAESEVMEVNFLMAIFTTTVLCLLGFCNKHMCIYYYH